MNEGRTVPVLIVNASPSYAPRPLLLGVALLCFAVAFRRTRWALWLAVGGLALIVGAFVL